jgi:hypothetical protein
MALGPERSSRPKNPQWVKLPPNSQGGEAWDFGLAKYNQQLHRSRQKPALIVTVRDRKWTLLMVPLPFSPIPSIVCKSVTGVVIFQLLPLRQQVVRELQLVPSKGGRA